MRSIHGLTGSNCALPTAGVSRRRWQTSRRLLCFVLLFVLGAVVDAQEEGREAAVRTGLLLKLSLYVQYPDAAFAGPEAPFEICVVDAGALEPILEKLTEGKPHKGRPLRVRRLEAEAVGVGCQVLYFGRRNDEAVGELLERVDSRPVLTIGDGEDFLDQGGAIQLMRVGKNLRFAIDRDAIAGAGLDISSTVLKLAEEVRGGQGKGRSEGRE